MTSEAAASTLPRELVASILSGDCVAFVGAGFSLPSVPGWRELLVRLADRLEAMGEDVGAARQMLGGDKPDASMLELAAALMERQGGPAFHQALRDVIPNRDAADAQTRSRVATLHEIPFAAILTTNFDGYLSTGATPDGAGEAWNKILRPSGAWYERYGGFEQASAPDVHVLELHGNVHDPLGRVVLTERAYRERLYGDPRYLSLMRALLATRTLLFLGVSFSDAYMRLLLAETLTLFETSGLAQPLAYAVLADVPPHVRAAYREQRGIEVISYPADETHSGFDAILRALRDETSPRTALARVVDGRRILWADDNPKWNAWGHKLLVEAGADIVMAPTADAAIEAATRAAREGRGFDLVLTRFGHADGHARRILEATGPGRIEAPVLVFASADHAEENKRRVLSWGGIDYVHTWAALFERIEMLFTSGEVSARDPFRR